MIQSIKWSRRDNRISRKELRDSVQRYSRQPFADVLTQFLQCRPTPEAIIAWAMDHPDKWASAVSIMAKLSGYADQQEINLNITDTSQMSDAHLMQRLLELRERLKESNTLDDSYEPVPVQNSNTPLVIIQQEDKEKPPSQRPGGS